MEKWFVSFLVCCLLSFILSSCGDVPLSAATISISPSSATVGLNKTQQFSAMAYDSAGQTTSATFTWSVQGGIGEINPNTGLFTAGAATGAGYITATASGISGQAAVTITDKGAISGRLTNSSGDRLENIRVFLIENSSFYDVSNSAGEYSITNITPGTYEVATQANLNYLSASTEATVSIGATTLANMLIYSRLSIQSDYIAGSPVSVSGTVRNNGATEVTSVSVVYTFYDEEGFLAGAGSANLGNIAGEDSQTFYLVPIPAVYSYSSRTRNVAGTGY